MPIYTYITKSAALQQLANRLYDPAMTFWASAELALYLNEALQTWNALTAFWRGDFVFPSVPSQTWYDIPSLTNTLRLYTVTDRSLYSLLQYHLLEPVTWNPWTGASVQFTADDLLNAVARRRDELLSLTACTISQSFVPAVLGRTTLPDSVIDVRRIAYVPSPLFPAQPISALWPEDTWAEQSFNRDYTIAPAGTPFAYLLSTQPPISFDVDVPPAYSGNYDILTVNAGAALSVGMASLLSVPDDWTHAIKWGALADLLSRESNAKDSLRATYCEQRYRLAAAALAAAPALLALRRNNIPLQLDSVRNADLYDTSWQNGAADVPFKAVHAGLNLLALNPSTGSPYGVGLYGAGTYGGGVSYSMTATVVQNAPLPVAAGDPVQVSRDDLDVLLDYAQHLAAFKMGGAEFASTAPLLTRFLKHAAVYNGKLAEIAEYTSMLLGVSQMEKGTNPVMTPAAEQEVAG